MAVKRFPTPIYLQPLSARCVRELRKQKFVMISRRDDGYEILVRLRDDVVMLSVDHIYAARSDRDGFQVTVFLASRTQEIWVWDDDGELQEVSRSTIEETVENDDASIVILEDDGDSDLIERQQQFARVFGSSEVGEG